MSPVDVGERKDFDNWRTSYTSLRGLHLFRPIIHRRRTTCDGRTERGGTRVTGGWCGNCDGCDRHGLLASRHPRGLCFLLGGHLPLAKRCVRVLKHFTVAVECRTGRAFAQWVVFRVLCCDVWPARLLFCVLLLTGYRRNRLAFLLFLCRCLGVRCCVGWVKSGGFAFSAPCSVLFSRLFSGRATSETGGG